LEVPKFLCTFAKEINAYPPLSEYIRLNGFVMNKEVWKNVVGYEGLYEVSNTAKIRNCKTKVIRKIYVSKRGYYAVGLRKDGKTKSFPLHRIMALAFIDKPKGKNYIDHIDGNKLNNTIFVNKDGSIDSSKTNIRWCTPSENNNNKITYIRHKASMNNPIVKEKIFNSLAKIKCERSPKKVYVYDMSNNYVGSWDSISKASQYFSIDSGTVSYAMRSRSHYAKGYKWYDKRIEPTQ
jgi:hypothetical protein